MEVDVLERPKSEEHKKPRVTIIKVNEQLVKIKKRTVTGYEIKLASIRQDVHIEENFVLQEELPNGTSRIIGDEDQVRVRKNLCFTAITPDDNS